jgi:hypothetical protein
VKVRDKVRVRVRYTAKDNGCDVDMFTDIALEPRELKQQ